MTDLVTAPAGGSGAGPAAGSSAGAGSGTPAVGGNAGVGGTGTGTGTGVDTGAGKGTENQVPKSVKIDFGDGAEDFSLEDATPAAKADPEFKFEQLEPLKDSHADLYKTLKAELSKTGRYGKVGEKLGVKTPEDFKSHVDRVEKIVTTIGRVDGKKGLDAIESTIGELASVLEKAQSGDDTVIGNWFKDNPQGMATMTSKAMEHLAKVDPNAWSAAHAQVAWSTLAQKDAAGVSAVDALNQMYEAVKDNPKARSLLERVAHTVNQISTASAYKPDPAQGLAAKEAQLKQRETAIWNKQTDMEVMPIVQTALRKGLSSLTTELKKQLSPEERSEFLAEAEKSFYSYAGKDAEFVRQLNEYRKSADREGIKSLVNRTKKAFAQQALKDLYRSKLLDRQATKEEAAAKAEANGGAGAAAGKGTTVKYTGKMSAEGYPLAKMDYARMNREGIQALDRQFYIVGQKELYSW